MRLGVLDVGSNTVHLLVVDAYRGAQPWPQHSRKSQLRLAEHIDARGKLADAGADALVAATIDARKQAKELACDELLAFATSSVRDARNSADVLKRVGVEAGVELTVLSGEDEARLTFLAVRRWLGWSAGNLICLDIGGGSLELGAGTDEDPEVAVSLPLGAARLTRDWFDADPTPRCSRCASTSTRCWPNRWRNCSRTARRTASSRRARRSERWPASPVLPRARPARAPGGC